MPHLYRHLQVHQVFGANTNVGKTIASTALCRSSVQESRVHRPTVFYLKPVSTGPPNEADDRYGPVIQLIPGYKSYECLQSHILRFAGPHRSAISSWCLFKYDEPVSPHLAAKAARLGNSFDQHFVQSVSRHISGIAKSLPTDRHHSMFVETAGGVHSPIPSGTTQAEAYRPLRLPIVLVGDSNLGGISSTISAYESLTLRGYDVESLLIFKEDYYRNWEYLSDWFAKRNQESTVGAKTHVGVLSQPPKRRSDPNEDFEVTDRYYREICQSGSPLRDVLDHLEHSHQRRIDELESMPKRTLQHVWWPFVQHATLKGPEDITIVDSAHGDVFDAAVTPSPQPSDPSSSTPNQAYSSILQPVFDGSASWWTQAFGHANPSLTLAASYASGRYGHVIFPLASHQPALQLAERLIKSGPGKGWAAKAFFSDNGSTGMEVALKMAIRSARLRYLPDSSSSEKKELGVLGLKGSYHGDTIGAMDACEGGVYNAAVEWYRGRGYWFDVPTIGIKNGKVVVSGDWSEDFPSVHEVYDVENRLTSKLADAYRSHIQATLERLVGEGRMFGALVIEPLIMGAAGMLFVDPLFHRVLIDTVRSNSSFFAASCGRSSATSPQEGSWTGLPVIYDEVFTGLYRAGYPSATSVLKVDPDISVLAKILTGGLLPLSATLASQSIYDAFLSPDKVDALLHGHSYTAHPVGCAVANEALNMLETMDKGGAWQGFKDSWRGTSGGGTASSAWSVWGPSFVKELSRLGPVEESMALGTVLAIHLRDPSGGYSSNLAQQTLSNLKSSIISEGDTFPFGVHFRTLGNVAYFMTSLNTSKEAVQLLQSRILDTLR
ncbi:hypothetical protein FRB90_000777 [Tulasnella sp. 427]|nr:hypothetical protein FRB90_000777 [Tulasnella sp. 427]